MPDTSGNFKGMTVPASAPWPPARPLPGGYVPEDKPAPRPMDGMIAAQDRQNREDMARILGGKARPMAMLVSESECEYIDAMRHRSYHLAIARGHVRR